MKEFFTVILTFLLTFSINDLDAKCDCYGNEIITVCQNGKTKRVNCSALSDPNVFCGPCSYKPDCKPGEKCDDKNPCTKWDKYDANCNCYGKLADRDNDGVCDAKDRCPNGDDLKDNNKNGMPDDCEDTQPPTCSECEPDEQGKITICWIPTNKDNLGTIKAKCEYLKNYFDEDGKLKGKNQCGPCKCEYVGDVDTDGDGVCDRKDKCPNNPDKDKPGPCGCDDEDSDKDWICDKDDKCIGHSDKMDADNDGIPDGCDCKPNDPNFPAEPHSDCDDGDATTHYDFVTDDGCGCVGKPIPCEIKLIVSDIYCDDNGTEALPDDDQYSFDITAESVENAGDQWEGGFDNAYLGAFQIPPTNYGDKVHLGPFPAGAFTSANTDPPVVFSNGLDINVNVNAVGDFSCSENTVVKSPGPCACEDSDQDGVCDDDDICTGYDDNEDMDEDGTPDGCDECPNNSDKTEEGECGCEDCPPDPCDLFCQPRGNAEHEWIDKISINDFENTTGPNDGYGDYRDQFVELKHGDSLSLWVFHARLENICELSVHIYIDWNGDCDFEDEDELVFWKRTLNETGTDIVVPDHAIEGDISIRFMVHYGRIRSACQDCIDGEVEDYTLRISPRDENAQNDQGSIEEVEESSSRSSISNLRISPNPVVENNTFLIEFDTDADTQVEVNVYSMDGNLKTNLLLDKSQKEFSTSGLEAGVYIFELVSEEIFLRETLVVSK